MRSTIETMIGRQLERQMVAGVEHFVPGQLAVRRLKTTEPPDAWELSMVDGMGWAWLVLCDKTSEGFWEGVVAFRGGQQTIRVAGTPPVLQPRWVEELEKAYAV